jgi:hypothetical protein
MIQHMGKMQNDNDLIRLLTGIIWTASVYHSAVNFGQARFFSFVPAAPTNLRSDPPTGISFTLSLLINRS